MAREINLVPDIKNEMIKALKLRNLIFFLCIVVASASVGITISTSLFMGGQQLVLDSKKTTIDNLSAKLNSYSDLKDFLTIKDQLGNLASISDDKRVFSRTFNILSALIPTGPDTIKLSELNVDLSGESPVYVLDAQANAGAEPFIDYNVLDAFKKSMKYMRYDYGQYVDKEGEAIPAYCMIESGTDGSIFRDSTRGIYALWTINAEGCAPAAATDTTTLDVAEDAEYNDGTEEATIIIDEETAATLGYTLEDYEGQKVVRIWRTPQYSDWYKETEIEGQPYMGLDGTISNVPHFASSCINYTGEITQDSNTPKWTETNDTCLLVPEGESGIEIDESSNGRGSDGELVLRFSAKITFNPEVYKFKNTHMLALAPSSRINVTDSYVQIQAMFTERATDCAEGDTDCANNTSSEDLTASDSSSNTNSNGNSSNASNSNNLSTSSSTNNNGGNR